MKTAIVLVLFSVCLLSGCIEMANQQDYIISHVSEEEEAIISQEELP